jgi:hypothetical protein
LQWHLFICFLEVQFGTLLKAKGGGGGGSENTRDLLVECAAAHLLQPKFATYGVGLPSSSRRVCLRGPAGEFLSHSASIGIS